MTEHLERCADCNDRLRLLLEIRENRVALRRLRSVSDWRIRTWPIAAGIVLAGLIGYWLAMTPRDVTQLAVSTPYPMVPPQLRSPRLPDGFIAAARAYAQNDWPSAERQFRQFLAQHPEDYEGVFYLANVLYARNQLVESEKLFTELARRNPQDNRVQWYLANLRLRQGDEAGTKKYLDRAARSAGEFQQEAISLLGKLRR
ncbi:MAG: tetratricopeptide repeat protein [Acidobacteria bacterium]|nr:tetratricopeptide repeat protein [Acidobacteriota bacterium]